MSYLNPALDLWAPKGSVLGAMGHSAWAVAILAWPDKEVTRKQIMKWLGLSRAQAGEVLKNMREQAILRDGVLDFSNCQQNRQDRAVVKGRAHHEQSQKNKARLTETETDSNEQEQEPVQSDIDFFEPEPVAPQEVVDIDEERLRAMRERVRGSSVRV